MKEVKIGMFNKVVLFDSIYEITKTREHEFQAYAMMDIGVGNDMSSVDVHHKALYNFILNDRKQDALAEWANLRLNYFYMIEKISFKSLCFSTMVHKINNEIIYDVSTFDKAYSVTEKLQRIGLKDSHVTEALAEVKKKLKSSLGLHSQIELIDLMSNSLLIK